MAGKRPSVRGKGADLFFGELAPGGTDAGQEQTEDLAVDASEREQRAPGAHTTETATSRSTSRSTSQSTTEPPNRSTKRSTAPRTRTPRDTSRTRPPVRMPEPTYSKIVDRPKAFYITERLDARIDEAVRYFQQTHGLRKVDRSTVLNALLDSDEPWKKESLDQLVDRLVGLLTSRLTGR